MAESDDAKRVDRRNFLRTIGAGAGASAVAATGVTVQSGAAEARENAADRKKARYKETDHVKTYYRTNRY
jgi:nitrous oxide reductase